MVSDGTAAAQHPHLADGYAAALTSFRYIANAVIDTDAATKALSA